MNLFLFGTSISKITILIVLSFICLFSNIQFGFIQSGSDPFYDKYWMMGVVDKKLQPLVTEVLWEYGLLFLLQHWEKLVPHGPEQPRGRIGHAMDIIHSPSQGDQQTLLLVTVGVGQCLDTISGAWLLRVGNGASWRKVSIVEG